MELAGHLMKKRFLHVECVISPKVFSSHHAFAMGVFDLFIKVFITINIKTHFITLPAPPTPFPI